MKRFILWVLLISLIGCVAAQQTPQRPISPAPPIEVKTMEEQLADLDPDDGKDEIVLIIGTDDDLFGGLIDMQNFYSSRVIMWAAEIDPHIDGDFVIFLSHGHTHQGQWFCEYGPPYLYQVDHVVSDIRSKLGEDGTEVPIVLIICNPWQYQIDHDANVYYGDANIFLMPDSAMKEDTRNERRNSLMCGEIVIGHFHNFIRSTNLQ